MTTPVAVFMGGCSHEHDISLTSGRTVAAALPRKRWSVTPVVIELDARFRIGPTLEGDGFDMSDPGWSGPMSASAAMAHLAMQGCALAWLALHGPGGEDGRIQGLLEWHGLPYTGCGVEASALAMNKTWFKALLERNRIATPSWQSVDRISWQCDRHAILDRIAPLGAVVVKAADQGSSYGVELVRDPAELESVLDRILSMSDTALCEKLIEGTELTCAVLGDAGDARALPLVEIVPKGEFFDLASKYDDGGADEIVPARVDDAVRDRFQAIALRVHDLLGARGLTRTDAILSEGELFVLETNTLPGMTPASLFPKAAAAVGIDFGALVDVIGQLGLDAGPRLPVSG